MFGELRTSLWAAGCLMFNHETFLPRQLHASESFFFPKYSKPFRSSLLNLLIWSLNWADKSLLESSGLDRGGDATAEIVFLPLGVGPEGIPLVSSVYLLGCKQWYISWHTFIGCILMYKYFNFIILMYVIGDFFFFFCKKGGCYYKN